MQWVIRNSHLFLHEMRESDAVGKKVIFCILDRGVQRVIKVVGAENAVKSRALR